MDISKYTSFFHDGEIVSITHHGNNIDFFLKSAEIDPADVDDIVLSKHNRLRGRLHVEGVKCIIENDVEFNHKIKLKMSDNDLLHLKIKDGVVFCEIGWRGSEPFQNDFSAFEIHAEKIWWENIQDLENLS